jgi:hypothetical protein
MKISEMRGICKPLGIGVEEVWSNGFTITAPPQINMVDILTPLGFKVTGIGVGYDYNRQVYTLYAEPTKKEE